MGKPLRLLLVEDSENDARLLLRDLRQGGYEVSCQRVDMAQRLVAELRDREWDLVIADYNMPRFSGMTALSLVRERGLDLPFIILSGQIGEDIAVVAMKAGANDYIMKDDRVRLLPAIERELREAANRKMQRQAEEELAAERNRALEAIQASEERYRRLVELSPEPIAVHCEGRIVYVNQAALKLAGVKSADELIGRSVLDVVHPESAAVVQERLHRLYVRGEAAELQDEKLVRPDGQVIDVEVASMPVVFQGKPAAQVVIRDVTERKRIERRRAVQYAVSQDLTDCDDVDEGLQRVLQTVGEGLGWALASAWSVDPAREALVCRHTWNADEVEAEGFFAACARAEVKPGRGLIGHVWQMGRPLWVADITADANYRYFRSALAEGLRAGLAFPIMAGQGVLGVVDFFSYEVRATDDDLLRLMATLGNQIGQFIERKRAEQSLREANRRLEDTLDELQRTQQHVIQQERLRALGEMASGVAHDLNNALQPVVGFSELLLAQYEFLPSEDVREYLQMINTGASDAAAVVRGLRDLYRPRPTDDALASVAVNEIVEQTVVLTRPKWKDELLASGSVITVHTELAPVPDIAASDSALREALTNLIFNAVDAMPHGGDMWIRTRGEGNCVVIEVEDSGVGMTPEVRARCLEPFFTTKGERGSGLGLPMVDGLVRQHGGSLTVESEPGRGTRFTIRLPVYAGAAAQQADSADLRNGLRVLVVDDEPPVRALLAAYLRADGHSVQTAAAGKEGFEKCRTTEFDVVLTDRAMPEMNGDQLAAAVKQIRPGTPVIMLTGFGDIMNALADKPANVDCVVGKPVTADGLREAVSRVLSYA